MEKEFVPYEQALALKELGFDKPCLASWTYKTKERIPTLYGCGALLFDTDGLITNQTEDIICSAPLYQQAFRWFREKYDYYYEIFIDDDKTFGFMISYFIEIGRADKPIQRMYTIYEEAELECLKKLIEIQTNEG